MSERFRSRGLNTLLVLGALVALLSLGTWQLQRRTWKNGIIAQLEQSLSEQPNLYRPPSDPITSENEKARQFKPVTISGQFLLGETWKLPTPTPPEAMKLTKDRFGYWLFTPLQFEGGIVVVNRGFVPTGTVHKFDGSGDVKTAPGQVQGILRLPQAASGMFMPKSAPERRLLATPDIPIMQAAFSGDKTHYIAGEYIEAGVAANASGAGEPWPLGRNPQELIANIPNKHLEYALTWYALALTLVGVAGAYAWGHRRR